MFVKGTTSPIQVASADTATTGGTMRDRESNSAVSTDTVSSFAYLPDLLDMPLEVINTLTMLTFSTVDGAVHSYPKQGVRLQVSSNGTKSLLFYTSMAGTEVEVGTDHCYLLKTNFNAPVAADPVTRTRIVLPEQEDVGGRRRALREHAESDLDKRCHEESGVCLHSLHEILHLRGHFDLTDPQDSRRHLEVSAKANGIAFAAIQKDPYSINSDSGFVSWDQSGATAVLGSGGADGGFGEEEEVIEYDEWGCVVEEGFIVQAYPLTKVRQVLCRVHLLSKDSNGYCECGAGRKIATGNCDPNASYDSFTCANLCRDLARSEGAMTLDLYDAVDERLVLPLSMTDTLTKDFFDVDKTAGGAYTGIVKGNVYISTRLAYRRETPGTFGEVDWPAWLDFHHNVRAHFTAASLSEDGRTWSDESAHGHHATVSATGDPLTSKTYGHGGGENFDIKTVTGSTSTSVTFDSKTFPPAAFAYHEDAAFSTCEDAFKCKTFETPIATALETSHDFHSFFVANRDSQNYTLSTMTDWNHECQNSVVEASSGCGAFYESSFPDFESLKLDLDAALGDVLDGIADFPPAGRPNTFDEYELCSALNGNCDCDGVMRFANATKNSQSVYNEGFTFGSNSEPAVAGGFDGQWMVGNAPNFDGEVAHYYKTSGSNLCSADNLVPAAMQGTYATEHASAPSLGVDLSAWNCHCKSSAKFVEQARHELTNNTNPLTVQAFLWEDWSTYKPFSGLEVRSQSSHSTIMVGEWTHIVVVFEAFSIKCYVKGELFTFGEGVEGTELATKVRDLNLGNSASTLDKPAFTLGYLRTWSVGLVEDEVETLYAKRDTQRVYSEGAGGSSVPPMNTVSFSPCNPTKSNSSYYAPNSDEATSKASLGGSLASFDVSSYKGCDCMDCAELGDATDQKPTDSFKAVDDDAGTCTSTVVKPGKRGTWEVELEPGADFSQIFVKSGNTKTSSSFDVFLGGQIVGKTSREYIIPEPGSSVTETTPEFFMKSGQQEFTYVSYDVALVPSVWVHLDESASFEGRYLEICEVEVFEEVSYFEAGTPSNPNVVLNRPSTSSSVDHSHDGPKLTAEVAVDGDLNTRFRTRVDELGMFRVDLDPGTLPRKVHVYGRSVYDDGMSCESQRLGLDGAMVSIGTPAMKFAKSSYPIAHSCGTYKYVITNEHDVNEHLVKIEQIDTSGVPLRACEVEIYVKARSSSGVSSEVKYDASGRHAFLGDALTGGSGATFAFDGDLSCAPLSDDTSGTSEIIFFSSPINNVENKALYISVDPFEVVTRVVIRTDGEQKDARVTLNNGIELLGGLSYDAYEHNATSFSLQGAVSSDKVTAQEEVIAVSMSSLESHSASYCGTAGSFFMAAQPYLSTTENSDRCACEELCHNEDGCLALTFVQSASSEYYRNCYLSTSSAKEVSPEAAMAYVSGGPAVLQGVTAVSEEGGDEAVGSIPDEVPSTGYHEWEFRKGCTGANPEVADTGTHSNKFNAKGRNVNCDNDGIHFNQVPVSPYDRYIEIDVDQDSDSASGVGSIEFMVKINEVKKSWGHFFGIARGSEDPTGFQFEHKNRHGAGLNTMFSRYSESERFRKWNTDLFVTPSLSIRTITNLPITFNDDDRDPSMCKGIAQSEVSTWELMTAPETKNDGEEMTLEETLQEYMDDSDKMNDPGGLYATEDGEQTTVFNDDRCEESWKNLKCNFPSAKTVGGDANPNYVEGAAAECPLSYFGTVTEDFPKVRAWCRSVTDDYSADDCVLFPAPSNGDLSDIGMMKAQLKLGAALDGIRGWVWTARLNKELKLKAVDVDATTLIQSPLLDTETSQRGQAFGAQETDMLRDKEKEFEDILVNAAFDQGDLIDSSRNKDQGGQFGYDMVNTNTGIDLVEEDGEDYQLPDANTIYEVGQIYDGGDKVSVLVVVLLFFVYISNPILQFHPTLNGEQKPNYEDPRYPDMNSWQKINTEKLDIGSKASVISYSGGGAKTSYHYSSSMKNGLRIGIFRGSDIMEASNEGLKIGPIGIYVDFSYEEGTNDGDSVNGQGFVMSEDNDQETEVDFTLSDPDIGDFFDVQIKRDPVYGTPVYEVRVFIHVSATFNAVHVLTHYNQSSCDSLLSDTGW
ncbi:hypothetical protein TrLO_g10830 [Triparma laevis f. longispina]|uniref:Uncharacterized protein n=1 Tax=Triparma laevis f. longispina TaxID=1714387 RepID=A0A9W7FQZ5_9STRA|nr:hypothetical protein TrLO_g10830 [Triparma laevis f. longispina]